MSELIERIQELEGKETQLIGLRNKVYQELGRFISAWDSGEPDQLPASREAMINEVRAVFDYVIRTTEV